MPDQKWKKSIIGRTAGWSAARIIASDDVSVDRWVEVRVNSIIVVRPNPAVISATSRMAAGVASKSAAVTGRFVTDGE